MAHAAPCCHAPQPTFSNNACFATRHAHVLPRGTHTFTTNPAIDTSSLFQAKHPSLVWLGINSSIVQVHTASEMGQIFGKPTSAPPPEEVINTRRQLFDRLAPDLNASYRLFAIRYRDDDSGQFKTFHHLLIQKLQNGGLQVDICDIVNQKIKPVLQTSLVSTWQPNSSRLIFSYPLDDWVCVLRLELRHCAIGGPLEWHAPHQQALTTYVFLA